MVVCVVPDTAAALAVGPIKPIIGQARSEPGLVCIIYFSQEFYFHLKCELPRSCHRCMCMCSSPLKFYDIK